MEDIVVANSRESCSKVKLEKVLEFHFNRLSEILAADLIVLSYQDDIHRRKAKIFFREFNFFSCSEPELELLTSDVYIESSLTCLELSYLKDYQNRFLYLCLLERKSGGLKYLLFLTTSKLSSELLGNSIRENLEILKEYLGLYEAYLQQQEEINNLEHLIHKIGHELRNPLSLIGLITENLRLSLSTHEVDEQIVSIQQTVQKINHNLSALIDCSKRAKLKLQLEDINVIFAQTVNYLKPMFESKQISLAYPENKEVILSIDSLQIQQVFGNLLSNAIYFSPQGGKITCNWQLFQEEVIITIADQGQGLSSQDLKNLFNPFYSRRPHGTGLGLTIVKKIIMDHGGSIWATNLPRGGSQFSFTLPR